MSKKICRTCLKMTYKTYKTHENINFPGETEQQKISDMLRYLIPELYLGVTVNPEVCADCRKFLRIAYAFRKQCMATENVIGCYLKKSRCTASTIELIDVALFWEQKRKEDRLKNNNVSTPDKAKEIISDWDDDASQDLEQLNISNKKEKTQIPLKKEKELILCPELGVFVDKFGNYYNADGISISDPEAIVNTDADFLKITEVFSLTEVAEKPTAKPTADNKNEQSTSSDKDNKVFRIRVIPEAKNSFDEPRISLLAEPKTDLLEPRPPKNIKRRRRINEAKDRAEVGPVAKPSLSNTPEISKEPAPPLLPIIVDVRSESESVELCSPFVTSDGLSENAVEPTTQGTNVVKEEPMERDSHDDSHDDEETLTGSETNSNLDSLQGIIDNVPEDTYVDVPEFVHISNFSMKDLDELRKKQEPKPSFQPNTQIPQFSPSSGNSLVTKKVFSKAKNASVPTTTSGGDIPGTPTNSTSTELANTGIFKRPFKNCVVPKCPNNTDLNPQKIYVIFPKKQTRRIEWFKAIDIEPLSTNEVYICEDHFDFSEDMENWEHFKVFGGIMRMKDTVIPHKYLKETIPHEKIYKSQIDEIERKRRAEQIERLEKIKIRKVCDSDVSLGSQVRGTTSIGNTNVRNRKSSASEAQNRSDGDCPYTLPDVLTRSEPKITKTLTDLVTKQALYEYENYYNEDKPRPRIIKRRGRKLKIVPVDLKETEKKNSSYANDVCVLFTNYTPSGLYINDHDYLITPYKRNKILFQQNDEWFCMCFLCGSEHNVRDHVNHMNIHSPVCNVCKANLGTSFMLNMHVRFHTKKCRYCTEKVRYKDIEQHEIMHLKEEVEFDGDKSDKKKRVYRRKRISCNDEEPVYFPIKKESQENVEPNPSRNMDTISTEPVQETKRATEIPQEPMESIRKISESPQTTLNNIEQSVPESIQITSNYIEESVPESRQITSNNIEESLRESTQIISSSIEESIPESTQIISSSIEESIPESTQIISNSIEESIPESIQIVSGNTEESKEIIALKTESSADSTVVAVSVMENDDSVKDDMKYSQCPPEKTPKKRTRKSDIKIEPMSPNTNGERKAKRKNRSREVEPVEIDQSSPRVLRSRQIKVKEEPKSPVPEDKPSC